jgi:hypothetical protein
MLLVGSKSTTHATHFKPAAAYAKGIFRCLAAAVKSSRKSRFAQEISHLPRYRNGAGTFVEGWLRL